MGLSVLIMGGGARAGALKAGVAGNGAMVNAVADTVLVDKNAAERACSALGVANGAVDLVIVPVLFDEMGTPARIDVMDENQWQSLAEAPLKRVRVAMQVASDLLRSPGGALILVLPEIGMLGVAAFTAQTMAAEGARSLGKAVARVWNKRGITVNTIALAPAQIRGEADGKPRPSLEEIGRLAVLLADGRMSSTGNTLFADGGEIMSI